jgi:hypothetical protein
LTNVRSIRSISTRHAANSVLTAGARLAAIKDAQTDLAAVAREEPLTEEQLGLVARLQSEELEARRNYEEAVHRFRFLTRPSASAARAATST